MKKIIYGILSVIIASSLIPIPGYAADEIYGYETIDNSYDLTEPYVSNSDVECFGGDGYYYYIDTDPNISSL